MVPQFSGVVLEGVERTIGAIAGPMFRLPVLVYERNTTTTSPATAVTLGLRPPYLAQTWQILILEI